jgi:toxin YoeB
MIKEIARDPFKGPGKPEPLKYALSGYWSRRITESDRMAYKVENDKLLIAQLRYHY